MRAIYKNLRDGERQRIMFCNHCGSEYSADAGDYFMVSDPDYQFKCCGKVMGIVTKHTVYDPVS